MKTNQRRCGTPMLREMREAEAREMQDELSPEKFRVWRIRQDEPYLRQSLERYGLPLPPELDESFGQTPKL